MKQIHHPAKIQKEDWKWRTFFKTKSVEIGDIISENELFEGLDECLEEIQQFENRLKDALK